MDYMMDMDALVYIDSEKKVFQTKPQNPGTQKKGLLRKTKTLKVINWKSRDKDRTA